MRDYSKQEVLDIVEAAAKKHGIPRDDFLRFTAIETGFTFDERAHNRSSGAKGLFQFLPGTAKEYGIAGREFDPVANADAGARFYNRNLETITHGHERTGRPYLSGENKPNGLDMYMAHQQGAGGYASIQAALDPKAGHFLVKYDSHGRDVYNTRNNILSNIGDDVEKLTGVRRDQLRGLSDTDLAKTFVKYWETKYDRIAIPEKGVEPLANGQRTNTPRQPGPHTPAQPDAPAAPKGHGGAGHWPAPGNHKINEADKEGEGKGEFGTSRGGGRRTHKGVDIQGNVGDSIESFGPGKVVGVYHWKGTTSNSKENAGNFVVIDHGHGITSTYMHLNSINVKMGQEVEAGTKIGTMGRTGNTPHKGDTHLHFEIRKDGVAVDPMPYLKGAKTLDGTAPKTQDAPKHDAPSKEGDKGAEVGQLQKRLNELGYTDAKGHKLAEDRDFGTRTREAVEAFQRENGLKPTGVADKDTMRLLDKGMTRYAAADGVLQPGEKGPDVRGLQTSLNELGMMGRDGHRLKIDGEYGPNVQAAVAQFQKTHGLEPTGIADQKTLEKIGNALNEKQHGLAPKPEPVVATEPKVQPKPEPVVGTEPKVQPKPEPVVGTTPGSKPLDPPHVDAHAGKLLLTNPQHPDNKLYQQALSTLEQLGPSGGFKSREEMEKAAAAVAADAKLSGLTQIDHITRSKNGEGLIAIQGADPWSDTAKRAFVERSQAVNQTVEQSSEMVNAKAAEKIAQPVASNSQLTTEPVTEAPKRAASQHA